MNPMIVENTPVEDHLSTLGLLVKREDLSCPPPGPPFSKARGVYAHLAARPEVRAVGVLDTYHSQAGHAVARACQLLGKQCYNYYPDYKKEPGPREPQVRAVRLGARLIPLPAGRSAVLYHAAKSRCEAVGGYMMPNALKLNESVEETAREVERTKFAQSPGTVIVPASSATIAAGVLLGFLRRSGWPEGDKDELPHLIVHMGYSRPEAMVRNYIRTKVSQGLAGWPGEEKMEFLHPFFVSPEKITVIDEGYEYRDVARAGPTPPFPCNEHYDLKAFRWWMTASKAPWKSPVLFWNVG